MPEHEIVSLHLGGYANYVGAHFWNLQDEVVGHTGHAEWGPYAASLDLSSRFSETVDSYGQVNWKPRALFVDLSGALGGVNPLQPDTGTLLPNQAQQQQAVSTWSGSVDVHAAPGVPRSQFVRQLLEQEQNAWDEEDEAQAAARQAALQQAAAALNQATTAHAAGAGSDHTGVRYWTDYLKVSLGPRNVMTLPGVWHGVTEFAGYGDGAGVMQAGSETREEMSEKIRLLVEDCDNLQGFQIMVDDTSGWGGVTTVVVEEVCEEYCGAGGRPCLLFSVRPPDSESTASTETAAARKLRRSLNEALVMSRVSDMISLYTPLTLPLPRLLPTVARHHGLSHLRYNPAVSFQTAGVLAAAIDCALSPLFYAVVATPCGSPAGATNLHSLSHVLTDEQRGSPLVAMSAALPAPLLQLPEHERQEVQQSAPPPQQPQASSSPAEEQLTDLSFLAQLTSGIHHKPEEDLAESLSVRGGRTQLGQQGPGQVSHVQAAIDNLLIQLGPRKCVSHRAVSPLPLLVPLPFPRPIWGTNIGSAGQIWQHGLQNGSIEGSALPARAEVAHCPVVTRLLGTKQFEGYTKQVVNAWRRGSGSGPGRAMLDHWQIDRADYSVFEESLCSLAGLYHEGLSDEDELLA